MAYCCSVKHCGMCCECHTPRLANQHTESMRGVAGCSACLAPQRRNAGTQYNRSMIEVSTKLELMFGNGKPSCVSFIERRVNFAEVLLVPTLERQVFYAFSLPALCQLRQPVVYVIRRHKRCPAAHDLQ